MQRHSDLTARSEPEMDSNAFWTFWTEAGMYDHSARTVRPKTSMDEQSHG